MRIATLAALRRIGILLGVLALAAVVAWMVMLSMPGESYDGPAAAPAASLRAELRRDVTTLAGTIGDRNVFAPGAYRRAADWIEAELGKAGYAPRRDSFEVDRTTCVNLVAERPGAAGAGIVVVGAHYDTVAGSPGANDNASGVATVLALARRWTAGPGARTVRFVFFANEEPPHFQTDGMGSLVYARRCKERGDRIVAMVSVETIGYYSDAPDSQRYPVPAMRLTHPTTGNFVGIVGNVASRALVRRCVDLFREVARIPSEGAAMIGALPGVGWSDHWSFWQEGYEAVMVTDTAPFRYPYYHTAQDTPDRLDYARFALVVEGLAHVLAGLAAADG